MIWHQLTINETLQHLESSHQGLSNENSQQRLQQYGPNVIASKGKVSWIKMLTDQFVDLMIIILLIAALVSGALGEWIDCIVILCIVLLNAGIGFFQQYRAEKAMEALQKLSTPTVTVKRNNQLHHIASTELVPGDIVLLEAGNIVPADLRLLEGHNLRVDEASLTGESHGVEKSTHPLTAANLPLGDRHNMLFKGTIITYGRGTALTVATGMLTELGKIASMLNKPSPPSPLQKRMEQFGKKLTWIVGAICVLIFLVGLLRHEEPVKLLLTAISVAVAAIPEALPAIITISLAFAAKKMLHQKALIRKLTAAETLGSVTYICSDKTGTLTQNIMRVQEMFVPQLPALPDFEDSNPLLLAQAMVLNQDIKVKQDGSIIGDTTEIALLQKGQEIERPMLANWIKAMPRVAEKPFDADRKCMTTIHQTANNQLLLITKGAPEAIFKRLSATQAAQAQPWHQQANNYASNGMRVIAYGIRFLTPLEAQNLKEIHETDLNFLGMAAIIDPVRNEVKAAISECKRAGIVPVMITGDHPATAKYIALQLGIIQNSENNQVITGSELEGYTPEQYTLLVNKARVYARVSPEQKFNIVQALQANKQFVAMTGDGVNDAPALKCANIGIAMGITGTDVAKEASHMVLLDDNFNTIVKAVREGRRVFENIRKFIQYVLTGNSGEIWAVFLAPLVGLPIPLMPIQILWVNLVTDGLPGLTIAAETSHPNSMKRPPRKPDESIFNLKFGLRILLMGLLIGLICLGLQYWTHSQGNTHGQALVFSFLCIAQLTNLLSMRTTYHLFQKHFYTNYKLLLTVLATLLLQIAILYIPFTERIFHLHPLSPKELALCFGLGALIFVIAEVDKLISHKATKHQNPGPC